MGRHHHLIGLFRVHAEYRLEHLHDEFARREIVVEQNHLVERRRWVLVRTVVRGLTMVLLIRAVISCRAGHPDTATIIPRQFRRVLKQYSRSDGPRQYGHVASGTLLVALAPPAGLMRKSAAQNSSRGFHAYSLDCRHRFCRRHHRALSGARLNNPSGFILTTLLGIAGAFIATFIGQAIGHTSG